MKTNFIYMGITPKILTHALSTKMQRNLLNDHPKKAMSEIAR